MKDAARLAEEAPWIVARPEPAKALAGTIIEALLACLTQGRAMGDRAAPRRHRQIVAKLERSMRERPEQMLSMPDICADVGVARRRSTLPARSSSARAPRSTPARDASTTFVRRRRGPTPARHRSLVSPWTTGSGNWAVSPTPIAPASANARPIPCGAMDGASRPTRHLLPKLHSAAPIQPVGHCLITLPAELQARSPVSETARERKETCRCASTTRRPTSPPRPPRVRSTSTSGSATAGRSCSRTPRTSRRSARPSSATWPG